MCFSASASFGAGSLLLAVGVVTIRKAGNKNERAYAAIPLLFSVQQLIEGVIWLSFGSGVAAFNQVLTFVYSLFSHVFWPIYVPFAALRLEPVHWRRMAFAACLVTGTAAALYLLINMFRFPIGSRAVGGHIEYASPHFYIVAVMAGYLTATCVSMLFSSHRWVRVFGLAALTSFVLSYAVYTRWLISVWCFFAAVLSAIVLIHFLNRPFSAKEQKHAMAL